MWFNMMVLHNPAAGIGYDSSAIRRVFVRHLKNSKCVHICIWTYQEIHRACKMVRVSGTLFLLNESHTHNAATKFGSMKPLFLPLALSLLASSASTFFVPPAPLLAPHPLIVRQAVRRLLQQHVHSHRDVFMAPHLSHGDNHSALPPSITELLEQMEDLHRLLAADRAYLHSFLPYSSSYPFPYPPLLRARIGDGLAQLDWLAGVVSAGRQDVDYADFASAGRHVRLMWKEYREKVRPFVLDVVREVEAAPLVFSYSW